jgi:HPt (histidine-containing phosphotransfer) domain-containing protein
MIVMASDMSRFHAMFFDEATEHLANIESFLSNVAPLDADRREIAEIYRCAHSIKGASATLGFDDMARVGHALADLLLAASKDEIVFTGAMIDACRGAREVLRQQLLAHRNGTRADDGTAAAICWLLKALREHSGAPSTRAPTDGPGFPTRRLELEFAVSRALATNEILVDNMLEELAGFGPLVVVERPADGLRNGPWRLELETGRPDHEVLRVLELLAEPGQLHVARCGADAGAAIAAGGCSSADPGPAEGGGLPGLSSGAAAGALRDARAEIASESVSRLREVLAGIRVSAGRIADLAARMDETGAHHAALLAEATALAQRLDAHAGACGPIADASRESTMRAPAAFSSSLRDSADMDAMRPSRRGSRAPLPKVRRAPAPRRSLEEEWEEF